MAVWDPPELYPKQEDAIMHPYRWGFVEAGTKSGKTFACLIWLIELALYIGGRGRNFWWVAPWYKQAKDIAFERIIASLPKEAIDVNKSDLTITIKVNGARIHCRSGEKPDTLYGDDVYAVVLDEATRMRPEVWPAVRSTLTATRGPARIVGNMRGRQNWVHKLALQAQAGTLQNAKYATLTSVDAADAGILDKTEIEDARATLPAEVFDELYMAIPTDKGSNPFGGKELAACLMPDFSTRPTMGWGWDLARKVDWTIGVGLDGDNAMTREVAMQHHSWRFILSRIVSETAGLPALVDETGIGDAQVERLREDGRRNFEGFIFTPQSRQQLLEDLAIGIHGAELGVVESSRAHNELLEFGYEFTRTKGVRYTVPDGYHDDAAMALALAYRRMRTRPPALRIL